MCLLLDNQNIQRQKDATNFLRTRFVKRNKKEVSTICTLNDSTALIHIYLFVEVANMFGKDESVCGGGSFQAGEKKKIRTAGTSYLSSLHKSQRKVTAIEERHLGAWRGRWGGIGRAGSRRSWASLKLV